MEITHKTPRIALYWTLKPVGTAIDTPRLRNLVHLGSGHKFNLKHSKLPQSVLGTSGFFGHWLN